jgi:hypothetical protein
MFEKINIPATEIPADEVKG